MLGKMQYKHTRAHTKRLTLRQVQAAGLQTGHVAITSSEPFTDVDAYPNEYLLEIITPATQGEWGVCSVKRQGPISPHSAVWDGKVKKWLWGESQGQRLKQNPRRQKRRKHSSSPSLIVRAERALDRRAAKPLTLIGTWPGLYNVPHRFTASINVSKAWNRTFRLQVCLAS